MTGNPKREPAELSREMQLRWDALKDSVVELSTAILDPEGFSAAFAQLRQLGRGLDIAEIINAVHLPDDAGEHADALTRMLARIPDGWGRWIGCSRGWYPLLVELDEQLGMLFPNYEIQQIKEKFGGLRFYWSVNERVTNPADPEPTAPTLGDETDPEKATAQNEWERAYEAWDQRLARYLETDEGVARQAAFDRRSELAAQLVEAAEQRASVTCELCGSPGQICAPGGSSWYQALCADCSQVGGHSEAGAAQ